MSEPETSPELMRAWAVLDRLRSPPRPSILARGVPIGLPLVSGHFRVEARERLVALVDQALAEAFAAIDDGTLSSDILEHASVSLGFAP